MSKPKPIVAKFKFSGGRHGDEITHVSFYFDAKGFHNFVVIDKASGASIRVDNRAGQYKARVTDATRLIEQTSNAASPVYRGRQRASRAAKPGGVGKAISKAFRVFRGEP